MHNVQLHFVDYLILGIYTVFVLGIGWALKRYMKTSTDFFLSGRSIPAWIAALAFISANLGANEVIGMGANGAKYGLLTCHFYWIGAVPAMVFVGLFMMPFYYGSKARIVPEYLKLRFDEKTRGFNAISFAAMTIFQSGISMYAVSMLLNVLLGWSFHLCVTVSAVIVLVYILLGGLTSAIYNEVLQFFLIFLGFLPLVLLGLSDVGGWNGLVEKLNGVAQSEGFQPGAWTSVWANTGSTADNPMHIHWFGMAMGLGFVLAFGYWCTDFLVVQRAMAAESMSAARRTPILAIVPEDHDSGHRDRARDDRLGGSRSACRFPRWPTRRRPRWRRSPVASWRGLIPPKFKEEQDGTIVLEARLRRQGRDGLRHDHPGHADPVLPDRALGAGAHGPHGVLHVGHGGERDRVQHRLDVRHLPELHRPEQERPALPVDGPHGHGLRHPREHRAGLLGDAVQQHHGLHPVGLRLRQCAAVRDVPVGHVLEADHRARGVLRARCPGQPAAALHHALTVPNGHWLTVLHDYGSDMAQNFWMAIFAWTTCFVVTIVVSLATRRKKTDEELRGLVYSLTPRITEDRHLAWYARPAVLAAILIAVTVALNVIFW